MKLASALMAVVAVVVMTTPARAAEPTHDRVIVFAVPAITWEMLEEVDTPTLDALIDRSAVAAFATRTAFRRPNIERGYLSMGAGNRAFVSGVDPISHLAFAADAPIEDGTAADAFARRVGRQPRGEIVHLGMPKIAKQQQRYRYGTEIGSMGSALAAARIPRGLVSAGDVAIDPDPDEMRRAAALGIVDEYGTVDHGRFDGLLTEDQTAPYGVTTDPVAFEEAVRRTLARAPVVLLDAGETTRADEHTSLATEKEATHHRRGALERTDHLLGRVLDLLEADDLLLVVAPSSPTWQVDPQLTVAIGAAEGFEKGWLRSATTRHDGIATISDVAPTVLEAMGVEIPAAMHGTPIHATEGPALGRTDALIELNDASLAREEFAASVFYTLAAGLFSVIAALAFVVFLDISRRPLPWLIAIAYLILAVPVAAHVTRALEVYRLGLPLAHVCLWGTAVVLAGLASLIPGPRWAGGAALMLGSVGAFGSDALAGGPLQMNGVFGHSPVVAGRFYGLDNPAATILYSSAILGGAGLVDLRGLRRAPWWYGVALGVIVALVGLPQFGANFGQLIAGIAGVTVAFTLARTGRLRWRLLAGIGVAAFVAATSVALFDLTRPAADRTHLGRFAAQVANGGYEALITVLDRKISASFGTLGLTQWTYAIPVALAVIGLLVYRPSGILREVIPGHPVLRGALGGLLIYGVVGFLSNDSGIAIPALVLAHVVPFLVLMGAEQISPRPPSKVTEEPSRPDPGDV